MEQGRGAPWQVRCKPCSPVHEVNIDSSAAAQLLHERGGRDGDRGPSGARKAPHSDGFGGLECALVGACGRGGHSVPGKENTTVKTTHWDTADDSNYLIFDV